MKVKYKLVIALALAVPFSLVSADELVIKVNAPVSGPGDEDYSLKLQETVTITPMNFKDVTVVPPNLNDTDVTAAGKGGRPRELPIVDEVAFRDTPAGRGY